MRYLCRQSPLASRFRSFLVLDGPSTDHYTAEALACRRFEMEQSGQPAAHYPGIACRNAEGAWMLPGTAIQFANPAIAMKALPGLHSTQN